MNRTIRWVLVALMTLGAIGGSVWVFLSPPTQNSPSARWLLPIGALLGAVLAFSIDALSASRGRKLDLAVRDGLTGNNPDGLTGNNIADSAEAAKRNPLHESLLADGNTIDTRYRYQRLLYASLQPAQTAAVTLAAVTPVAVGGLLVWTLFEPSAREAVGIYLIVASLGGAVVWLATSPLYLGWWADQRGEALRVLVLGNLRTPRMSRQRQVGNGTAAGKSVPAKAEDAQSAGKSVPAKSEDAQSAGKSGPAKTGNTQSVSKSGGRLRRAWGRFVLAAGLSAGLSDLEPALAASYGFSVFALWPDTEAYLTSEESRRLSALVMRMRALRSVALTATLAAAASLGVAIAHRGHAIALFGLALAFILVAGGSLTRSNWARAETLHRKAQLVARHASDLLTAYGIRAKTPDDRLAALGRLSVSILDRTSGLPWSSRPGTLGADSLSQVTAVVGESFEDSLRKALRRRVATNVMGALRLSPRPVSAIESDLDVEVTTGDTAWRQATGGGRTRFQVTGGEEHEAASFEVAVDAPGLDVSPPREKAELACSDGAVSWTFSIRGKRQGVSVWVTLYSSGRYVQAVELQGESLVPRNGR